MTVAGVLCVASGWVQTEKKEEEEGAEWERGEGEEGYMGRGRIYWAGTILSEKRAGLPCWRTTSRPLTGHSSPLGGASQAD